MTSNYSDLIRDFRVGLYEGEDPVQELLYKKYGAVCKNVGKENLGWDLEVVDFDESHLGCGKDTFDKDKFLSKFVKDFGKRFEVKRDKTGDRSGNFYWECWSNFRVRNPGCMLTCKADTIVIVRSIEFIFLKRAIFLSWVFDNLFLRSDLSTSWRTKTFRGKKEVMISAKNNPDVRGILLPLDHVKSSPACFHIEHR